MRLAQSFVDSALTCSLRVLFSGHTHYCILTYFQSHVLLLQLRSPRTLNTLILFGNDSARLYNPTLDLFLSYNHLKVAALNKGYSFQKINRQTKSSWRCLAPPTRLILYTLCSTCVKMSTRQSCCFLCSTESCSLIMLN